MYIYAGSALTETRGVQDFCLTERTSIWFWCLGGELYRIVRQVESARVAQQKESIAIMAIKQLTLVILHLLTCDGLFSLEKYDKCRQRNVWMYDRSGKVLSTLVLHCCMVYTLSRITRRKNLRFSFQLCLPRSVQTFESIFNMYVDAAESQLNADA